jgi:ESCRT-II complex subunit VPS22
MSNRRGVGLGAFTNKNQTSQSYASHGSQLRDSNAASLQTQLSVFQSLLHTFALEHAADIKSNPTFRAEFARMCNAIGVDPLAASNIKGKRGESLWARMLGNDVNDFYFEVAVRIVELCRATRTENGGLLGVTECCQTVAKGLQITEDDVLRAVKSLEPLGSGFSVLNIGSKQFIGSIPKELNTDQSKVLEVLQILNFVTISMLQINLEWEKARATTVVEDLLADSLVWIDAQAEETEYWSPQNLLEDQG